MQSRLQRKEVKFNQNKHYCVVQQSVATILVQIWNHFLSCAGTTTYLWHNIFPGSAGGLMLNKDIYNFRGILALAQ